MKDIFSKIEEIKNMDLWEEKVIDNSENYYESIRRVPNGILYCIYLKRDVDSSMNGAVSLVFIPINFYKGEKE